MGVDLARRKTYKLALPYLELCIRHAKESKSSFRAKVLECIGSCYYHLAEYEVGSYIDSQIWLPWKRALESLARLLSGSTDGKLFDRYVRWSLATISSEVPAPLELACRRTGDSSPSAISQELQYWFRIVLEGDDLSDGGVLQWLLDTSKDALLAAAGEDSGR